jgi:hypothetical protein
MGLPSIAKKIIIRMATNFAEETLREGIHNNVVALFQAIEENLIMQGTTPQREEGQEIEEDQFGFPMKDGGFKAYSEKFADGVGDLLKDAGINPMDCVNKVVDVGMFERATAYVDQIRGMLASYSEKVDEAHTFWLESEGGAKRIAKCKGNPKKLRKVEVPMVKFQKAGLQALMAELQPHLDVLTGELPQRTPA